MSDSDSQLLTTNNIYNFQNESTTVSARGPNINTTNLTGMSFQNNILTSTMNMPWNNEWQRRAESNYHQRRIGYQREASPVSIASARQRNFNSSYYGRRMSSKRSVFNGRSGSPTSVRSIDSNATTTAKEIVMALHTTQFNKYDMNIIKKAVDKAMKQKSRKLIEKRRNRRHKAHKGYRQKSGNDSGDLASNSSISSDDRSSIISNYKNNISRCMSTKTDVSNFRRTIKESNLFKDCSDNFRQNRMHTVVGKPTNLNSSRSSVSSFRSIVGKPSSTKSMPPPTNFNKTQHQSFMTQRDRFKNGFLLPSKRFHMSVAGSSKHHPEISPKNAKTNQVAPTKNLEDLNSDDDDDEIFSKITTIDKPAINLTKRSIASDDDICLPSQKRPKVLSPCKNMMQSLNNSTFTGKAQNGFVFPKPAFPVRKSANLKAKEIIIAKSDNMNTATEKLVSNSGAEPSRPQTIHIDEDKVDAEEPTTSQNTTDLSMRPSFIKRKLYSQKMDVTENKANDILAANSPQNSVYGAIQKEKNKARKLVTSQYCLSRDIQTDENNLLDLIHKIVPAERMSATKTAPNNISEDDDKWDVTSIISTRKNDEDLSDTFTDEDLLNANNGKAQPSPKASKNPPRSPKVAGKKVGKSPIKVAQVALKVLGVINGTSKNVRKYVKSFWDTDVESDAEGSFATRKVELKENYISENTTPAVASKPTIRGVSSMPPSNRTLAHTTINSTVFNNTNRNYKIFTHRNTKPNPKKTVSEKHKEDEISHIEPLCNKQTSSNLDLSVLENNTNLSNINNNEQNKKSKAESNKSPPKKQNRKTNKEKDKVTPKKPKQKGQTKNQNSKQGKVLKSVEKCKSKNNIEIDSAQAKPQDKELIKTKPENTKKSDTTQNKGQKENKNQNKTQNKNAGTNNKPQSNKTSGAAHSIQNNKNKKLEDKKADNIQQETTGNTKKNNQNTKRKKTVVTKLSDSMIYENRPVRSCRISKQNSNEAKETLNMTLRSRTSNSDSFNNNNNRPKTNKPAVKTTRTINSKNDQSLLSDLSFSLPQGKLPLKKPFSNLYNAKKLDNSDVSFSITNDKDSPLHKRGQRNSRYKNKKTLGQPVVMVTPIKKDSTRLRDMTPSKHELRPIRNTLVNKR